MAHTERLVTSHIWGLQDTQKLTLQADGEIEIVKVPFMSGTTVDNLMTLLREQSNSFDTEQVTFRGDSGMLESIERERPVQTLADRNGTINFEGKKAGPSVEESPDAAVGPSDAVSRNEVGETKLRGRATLHVGDRYAGSADNIPAWLKKGVYNSIKKHDAADDTESHVGNISGL